MSPYLVDLEDYWTELVRRMSNSWCLAWEKIESSQQKQKAQYDKSAQEPKVRVGDRVMVHMPGELKGKDHKLARSYHGPFVC